MANVNRYDDIKIFILYIMKNIGYSIDFGTLLEIVISGGDVKYFDFIECFDELIAANNVKRLTGEAGDDYKPDDMFEITEQGKNVAEALYTDLSTYLRDKSLKKVMQYLSFKKSNTSVETKIRPLFDQRSEVEFIFKRGDDVLLDVKLLSDNIRQTEMIRRNIDENPENIYRGVISMLSGDADYLMNK